MKENELEEAAEKHVKDKYPHYLFPLVLADLFLAGAHHADPIVVERTVREVVEILEAEKSRSKNPGIRMAMDKTINQINQLKKP